MNSTCKEGASSINKKYIFVSDENFPAGDLLTTTRDGTINYPLSSFDNL